MAVVTGEEHQFFAPQRTMQPFKTVLLLSIKDYKHGDYQLKPSYDRLPQGHMQQGRLRCYFLQTMLHDLG